MNDKQTKKALECCVANENCKKCPLAEDRLCFFSLKEKVLDLINRQQAKNNKLELENEVLKDAKNQLENELCNERMNLEHIVAENERLQKKYDRAMDNLKVVLKERAGEQDA